jgi:serine/threonine protein kinase
VNPERWAEIERLYHLALERPPAERATFLDHACPDDAALRDEVIALLERDALDDGFLDAPALAVAARTLGDGVLPDGARLGDFEIVRHIGRGGMGDVYQARDVTLGRVVAIKLLPDTVESSAASRSRLVREARAASALNHPNIVTIHAVEDAGGRAFIVMEYVEGQTLAERLADGPLEWREMARIAADVADALDTAHAIGIVHRDIKPANIVITPDGRVKVLAFGIAARAGEGLAGGESSDAA